MNIPLHLVTGPHGLKDIDFRSALIDANLADVQVQCHASSERPGAYWVALHVDHAHCADAYCTAPTKAERNEAIQWLRDMAAVLQGGVA